MNMNVRGLPQICWRCQNKDISGFTKPASAGKFFRSQKYNSQPVWVCHSCLSRRRERPQKPGRESPLNRRVREALMVVGEQFFPEYEMKHGTGSYFFDFAFPKLKLLLEIDGWSYHHTKRQKIRDACKHKFAEAHGWKLIRLKGKTKIGLRAVRAVRDYRLQKLSSFAGTDDPEALRLISAMLQGG